MKIKKYLSVLIAVTFIFCLSAVTASAAKLTAPVVTISCAEKTGKPTLKWEAVEGATKYQIWRSKTGKAGSFALINTVTGTSTTNNNAVAGTKYFYKVKAVNANSSVFSQPVSTVCDLPSPENLTITNDAATGKPKLTWNKVEGAVKYQIYRSKTGKDGSFSLINTITGTSTVNKNAEAGTTYYYKVKAVHTNANANSAFSAKVNCVCDLARPTNLTITNDASTGKPVIKWDAVDGAAKYQVYRSKTGKDGSFALISTTTAKSLINKNAVAGTNYYYKVKAVHTNANANSAFSSSATCLCKLAKPEIISVTNDASGKPVIKWNAVEGAVKYQIYRSKTGKDGSFSLINTVAGTCTTNNNAVDGQTYYYKIKAVHSNTDANSVFSDVKVRTGKLSAPVITVVSNSDGNPYITWNAIDGAAGYEIYRAVNENGLYRKIFTAQGTSFTNSNLCNGATYYYRVVAVSENTDLNSEFSNTVSFIAGGRPKAFRAMYVTQLLIKAYEEPVTDYNTITIPYMYEVHVGPNISESADGVWTQIRYNEKIYYTWIAAGDTKFTDTQSNFDYTRSEYTEIQNKILASAVPWKDQPTYYAHGQSNGVIDPATGKYGFDCSGFVRYIIANVMQQYNPSYFISSNIVDLYNHKTLYNKGFVHQFDVIDVDKEDLQPGDVIFFKLDPTDSRPVTHCVLYLGNNEYIHSTDTTDGVYIAPLTQERIDNIVAIKRYFPEAAKPANQTLVNTEGRTLGLFAEASTDSERIGDIPRDSTVTLLYTNYFENWGYVQTDDGVKGYVLLKYFAVA